MSEQRLLVFDTTFDLPRTHTLLMLKLIYMKNTFLFFWIPFVVAFVGIFFHSCH